MRRAGMASTGEPLGGRSSSTRARRPQSPPLYRYLLDADDDLAAGARPAHARRRAARWRRPWCSRPRPASATRPRGSAAAGHGPACCCSTAWWPSTRRSATAPRPSCWAPAICCSRWTGGIDDLIERDAELARPRARRASRCSTTSSPSACCPGRRSRRRCCAARASAPRISTCSARSPASRGSRCAWCCCSGIWPLAGAGWSRAASALSLPLTHRLLGQLVGAERPVGLPRPGAPRARPGSSPAAGDDGTCTAGSSTTSRLR